jgi:hypothetical protein
VLTGRVNQALRRTFLWITRIAAATVLAATPTTSVSPVAAGVGAVAIGVMIEAVHPQLASADNIWLHSCALYGNDDVGQGVWVPQQAYPPDPDFSTTDNCNSGGAFGVHTTQPAWGGHWEQWLTVAPAGISIDSAWTSPTRYSSAGALINCQLGADGYTGWYVWGSSGSPSQIVNYDGSNSCPYGTYADGTPINASFPPTNYFGFQLRCDKPSNETCPALQPGVALHGVQVGATENGAPTIGPSSASSTILFNHNGGFVRGSGFDVGMTGWDPSGICDMRAWLNDGLIQGPTQTIDQSVWDQCDDTGATQQWDGPSIDTTQYPDGTPLKLTYQADNAAGNWATSSTSTSYVDNSEVTLSLTGPTRAPVTAGPAYVTATSSTNPSGDTIFCQADGGVWSAYSGTSARIAVSGLGPHQVSCYAEDSAQDNNGEPGRSPTETWTVKVGEPVDAGITFARVIRTCRRVRVREHHHRTRELRCHTATPQRRVEHVAFGRRTTLRGWFATADGAALGHVRVRVLAAPDNGLRHWRKVTTVSTAANGSWRAMLPAGPSRLVEAVYGGGPLTEPETSPIATLLVPASSTLSFDHVVHFGQSLVLTGHLLGGYVPPTGTIVVVEAFDRGHWRNIATVRSNRSGRWRAHYALNGGAGSYPVRVRIPRQAAYPWATGVTPAQTLVIEP